MSEPLIHLGSPDSPVVLSPDNAALVAQIPDGMPVKMVVDVATNSYRYEALTPDEVSQRTTDQAAADAQAKADVQAQSDRDALVAKLSAGNATPAEVQQALAQVLG